MHDWINESDKQTVKKVRCECKYYDFVEKMAKYLSFLFREREMWKHETSWTETVKLFNDKIETVRDICTMFGVREEVWNKAKEIYDWESEDEK